MIVSHKYKFIFVKTAKTAGTSIEVYLSDHCGNEDIVTPIYPAVESHRPRNHDGFFNPLPELLGTTNSLAAASTEIKRTAQDFLQHRRYYSHLPARKARARLGEKIWNGYFKFCVDRNPWDKTVSHYHMVSRRAGGKMTLAQYFERGRFCLNYPRYADKNGLLVDRVIHFENLSAELGEILAQLGIPFDGTLGVKAKSDYRTDRRHYREILSAQQREAVREAFQAEIDLHGYEF